MFSLKSQGLAVSLGYAQALPGKMDKGLKDGLMKASHYWLSQHKQRWIKRESPEGKSWTKNNPLWASIKGQTTPLTGITQGTTRTWRGIKFKGNTMHMRSALLKKVEVSKVTFYYPPTVQDRARATQYGKKGAVLIGIAASGAERRFTFDIPARPHTGIGPTDATEIGKIFGKEAAEAFK